MSYSSLEPAPPLPTSEPPQKVPICLPEKDADEVELDASSLRLEADLTVEPKNNFLQPARVPKRRRSPVTVQEWVASLPIPHLLSQKGSSESLSRPEFDAQSVPQLTLSSALESQPISSPEAEPQQPKNESSCLRPTDDSCGPYGEFRRLSAAFDELEEKATQDQDSDDSEGGQDRAVLSDDEDGKSDDFSASGGIDEDDTIKLGEEASVLFGNTRGDIGRYELKSLTWLADRRHFLIQSHEQQKSFLSDFSQKTTASSVDSLLMSRTVDPAELLLDLGFGEPSTSILARIPVRFFSKSQAKGISVESFLRSQEEMVEKFDSGFSGYRGLSGSPNVRPSKLVEKIIDKIRLQERLRRQATGAPSLANSVWALTQQMGRKSKLTTSPPKFGFANVVNQALEKKNAGSDGLKGARAFRAAAQSVLSPANREFMAEQARRADRLAQERHKKKLVIAGKTFSIDEDDLSVVDEEGDVSQLQQHVRGKKSEKQDVSPILPIEAEKRRARRLSKRDSSLSVMSSCSVESDWSDEELEELEKMFGNIQHKSSMAENQSSSAAAEAEASANNSCSSLNKWRQLKRSRRMAMAKLNEGKTLRRLASNISTGSSSMTDHDAELIFSRVDNSSPINEAPFEVNSVNLVAAKSDGRVPRRFSTVQPHYHHPTWAS